MHHAFVLSEVGLNWLPLRVELLDCLAQAAEFIATAGKRELRDKDNRQNEEG
jgi:hypothetical protein